MSAGKKSQILKIHRQDLKIVEYNTFLTSLIAKDGNCAKEIKRKIVVERK